ncbi:MAG: hypothetical protein OXK79_09575 [Chloroflexota bacterium]|nr:hypothetical protein [Chloroflexota bacterium]
MVRPRQDYPTQNVTVLPVRSADEISRLFPAPPGMVGDIWPPVQLTYLSAYLEQIRCATVLIEDHYVDRDYVEDMAIFYARSLRAYPPYCQRMHFFSETFDETKWRDLLVRANRGEAENMRQWLQESYLGFCVTRPLPGSPLGRTVVATFGSEAGDGLKREFEGAREYIVHLGGFELHVEGLAFQQQDQGVSACATIALWSAIHRVAPMEGLPAMTPAQITEAATRYYLPGGRALPSEGLTVNQLCEAIRAGGLAPIVIPTTSPEIDRGQLLGYIRSGLAPVLAVETLSTGEGHAVCAVGVKVGAVKPQTDMSLAYRDGATALQGLYLHDDRLGPYASADIYNLTDPKSGFIRTALRIRWPGSEDEADHLLLRAIVVPAPAKIRLTVTRMRSLGLPIADATGVLLARTVDMNCRYDVASSYRARAFQFDLTDDGAYLLSHALVLSRYIGLIELSDDEGPLMDILLDSTETVANPSVLACVVRRSLDADAEETLAHLSQQLAAAHVS